MMDWDTQNIHQMKQVASAGHFTFLFMIDKREPQNRERGLNKSLSPYMNVTMHLFNIPHSGALKHTQKVERPLHLFSWTYDQGRQVDLWTKMAPMMGQCTG